MGSDYVNPVVAKA